MRTELKDILIFVGQLALGVTWASVPNDVFLNAIGVLLIIASFIYMFVSMKADW